ncbi:hypothetical protein [Microbacterium sp. A1-JK]|uniref:hypothetical protein n=1 Tax=Microbacterium sp. A1-JK TaxID=3177516 RepID=UPI00388B4A14
MKKIRGAASPAAAVTAAVLALTMVIAAPAVAQPATPIPVEDIPGLPAGGVPEQQSTVPEGEFTPPGPLNPTPAPVYTGVPAPPTVYDRYPGGLPLDTRTPQSVIDARAERSRTWQTPTAISQAPGSASPIDRATPVGGSAVPTEVVAAPLRAPRVVAWNLRVLLHDKTRMLPRGRIAYF